METSISKPTSQELHEEAIEDMDLLVECREFLKLLESNEDRLETKNNTPLRLNIIKINLPRWHSPSKYVYLIQRNSQDIREDREKLSAPIKVLQKKFSEMQGLPSERSDEENMAIEASLRIKISSLDKAVEDVQKRIQPYFWMTNLLAAVVTAVAFSLKAFVFVIGTGKQKKRVNG